MEEDLIIAGYHALIDETKAGFAFSVFVSVKLDRQIDDTLKEFEATIRGCGDPHRASHRRGQPSSAPQDRARCACDRYHLDDRCDGRAVGVRRRHRRYSIRPVGRHCPCGNDVCHLRRDADLRWHSGHSAWRVARHAGQPMAVVATLICYWLLALPFAYVLAVPLDVGPNGVWIGYGVGLVLASVVLVTRFWAKTRAQ